MELYDPQLKTECPESDVVFDYEVRIFSQAPTRIMLNQYESASETFKAYTEIVLEKLGKEDQLRTSCQQEESPNNSGGASEASAQAENIVEVTENAETQPGLVVTITSVGATANDDDDEDEDEEEGEDENVDEGDETE